MARTILFLTDYGLQDGFVGVCHAVMARAAPEARVIDLTHGIPPQDVLAGALALREAVPHAAPDTVYLGVVDPGVGTERRGVALGAGDAFLVGPDNGLLLLAAGELGGARRAVEIDPRRVASGRVSATFHGRDVFAPAAARLAAGAELRELGGEVDPAGLAVVEPDEPTVEQGRVETSVLGIDRFGNLRLAVRPQHLRAAGLGRDLVLHSGTEPVPVRRVGAFAALGPDELGILEDSGGWLAVVRNGGNAARALGLERYAPVILSAGGDAVG